MNIMHEIAKEIGKLAGHDWFDWLSMIISVLLPVILFLCQRRFDQKQNEKIMSPRLALGNYKPSTYVVDFGKFIGTDVPLNTKNRFNKSIIEIPLYNVGKSPVSNVKVTYSVDNFDENSAQYITARELITDRKEKSIYLIDCDSDNNCATYFVLDNPLNKESEGTKKRTIKTHLSRSVDLSPILSGDKQIIEMDMDFELLVQSLLFKSWEVASKQQCFLFPYIKFEINYTDYEGNDHNDVHYLQIDETGPEVQRENGDHKITWQLTPVKKPTE